MEDAQDKIKESGETGAAATKEVDHNSQTDSEQKSASAVAVEESEESSEIVDVESSKMTLPDVASAKTGDGNGTDQKISKNHLKRMKKWEQKMEVKRRRKEQEKNVRHARATAQGRDIDAEREDMEERRKDGSGWARRNAAWKERFEEDSSKYQICIDCSFEDSMTEREINSLASQIRYCYATNKKAKHPVKVNVTSLCGETLDHLKKVMGFENWTHRGFHHTPMGLEEAFPAKTKLVYLTSDSNTVLEKLQDDHVYIIGGIVDRNRLKRAAIDRAEALGIATAKLPIDNYFSMVTTKVLTCNHVFDILVKLRENGDDWKKAFLDVLPVRKEAKEKAPEVVKK